jgi:aspartate-semialdehyde dehydrogenase
MPPKTKAQPTLSIVGGQTLLGRELREVLEEENRGAFALHLFDTEDDQGKTLIQADGELAIMAPMDAIDVNGVFEAEKTARLRSPLAEKSPTKKPSEIQIIAHPASTLLALFLQQLAAVAPYQRAVAQVFLPASDLGQAALTELQQQTVSLLSFKKLDKAVYDTQAAFAMLARHGLDAPQKLEDIEARVRRHLAALLHDAPQPSVRLLQAPVFHGLTASLWVEFPTPQDTATLAQALAGPQIDYRGPDLDSPSNVAIAGQSGITVSNIEPDPAHPNAFWFWLAADNHRLIAQNAMLVAQELLPQ